jgi:hypothetical protein
MKRENRDSKFVIYQVLYIFVITVLALKGADLDLGEVVKKEEAVTMDVRDSLVTLIDSLYKQGLKFKISIDPDVKTENVVLKQQLELITRRMENLNEQKELQPPPIITKPEVKEETKMQSPLSASQSFIQNTWNIAKNNGNVPVYIYDPANPNTALAVAEPGKQVKFDLRKQTEVIVQFGSQRERVAVASNMKPAVRIEKVTTKMNAPDIYVRDLQKVTAFNVIISDERPEQLKINFTGPIAVTGPQKDTRGNIVYNVSLKLASNESRFDEWAERNDNYKEPDGRYKASFFFTVTDVISGDRIQAGDVFYFTDYSN